MVEIIPRELATPAFTRSIVGATAGLVIGRAAGLALQTLAPQLGKIARPLGSGLATVGSYVILSKLGLYEWRLPVAIGSGVALVADVIEAVTGKTIEDAVNYILSWIGKVKPGFATGVTIELPPVPEEELKKKKLEVIY